MMVFGVTVLQTLFGTSTLAKLHQFHETLNELQHSNTDIVHSVSNQVTYIKKLEPTTVINVNAIVNLSNIVKDFVVHSHNMFQQITRDILWLNATIHNHRELCMVIRQLEFALLKLIQQIDELLSAIQCMIQGNLSMNIINPTTLHNILRNMSLHLSESYEMIVVTRTENVHLDYELVKVRVVGKVYYTKLITNVPLKTASRHFTLYKINALSPRISEDKFVKHSVDFPYCGQTTVSATISYSQKQT